MKKNDFMNSLGEIEAVCRDKFNPTELKALERDILKKYNPDDDLWARVVQRVRTNYKWLPKISEIREILKSVSYEFKRETFTKIHCPKCLGEGFLWSRQVFYEEVGRWVAGCGCGNTPRGYQSYTDQIKLGAKLEWYENVRHQPIMYLVPRETPSEDHDWKMAAAGPDEDPPPF